ncbi:hypothetical protein AVEN_249252-1 [Araneus ventricosus]|uniref:Uncharacterized protein n=1 Tax=Araneus ventricosus TaxID=182803 RepID=A0A4Y2UW78_ARAVE|nr:hypothetical protein AVEN_249252-1 [Araneus ventricosus]
MFIIHTSSTADVYLLLSQIVFYRMLDSIEVYDPEANKWQELPDALHAPTMGLGVCAHKGQLWVIGGMVQNAGKTDLVKDVRCYDPVAKE